MSPPTLHDWLQRLSALDPEAREAQLYRMAQLDPKLADALRAEIAHPGIREEDTVYPDAAGEAGETTFFGSEPAGEGAAATALFDDPVADDKATTFPGAETAAGAPVPAQRSGEWIGRYRVLGKLGEGGMGVVYEAEQERPRRRVAIKVIRATAAHMRRRFEWEAEVLARLDHPAIARILEAHADPQRSWFAMEFVSGRPLDEAAAELGLPRLLSLLADIADAVHHAHLKGVVHRDLKPGNILVTEAGQPKVLDFGIARAMDEEDQPGHTRVGQIIGTPQYMSPEQATVGEGGIDGRSDVYALGVIAFELLAGRPPYEVSGKPLPELVRVITEVEAPPLTRIHRELPTDVAVIVAKCLEKDPAARYQSAWDLAEDLRRLLRDEPILARPATATYQMRKFAKRNRGLTASMLGIAAIVLLAGVVSTVMWRRAEAAADRAEQARHALQVQADVLLLEQARSELGRDPTRAVAWLDRLGPDAAWDHAFAVLEEGRSLGVARHVLAGHVDEVRWSDVSADGRWLATGGYDDSVRVWDLATGEGRVLGEHGGDVRYVGFAADGRLWSVSRDRTARLWDLRTGEFAEMAGHGAKIEGARRHPTQPWIATAADDGSVWLWDEHGRPIRSFDGHAGPVEAVAFSPDGALMASAGENGAIGLWDVASGEGQWLEVHTDDIRSLEFSEDGSLLASASRDGTVGLVDVATRTARRLEGHDHEVRRLGFVAGGMLVSGARDGELLVWDVATGAVEPLGTVGGVVRHLDVAADKETVAVGVEDGTVWLFDVVEREGRALRGHLDAVRHVGFSPDGRWLVSSSADGTARVWPADAHSPTRLVGHERRIMDLAFSPDGSALLTASSDYTARLWSLRTGRSRVVGAHTDEVEAVGFSRGRPVSVSRDMTLRIEGRVLEGRERIDGLAISPDGRWAAGAMRGGALSVWDLDSGELRELEGHRKRIHAVAFSAAGELASGGKGADLRVWDVAAGTSAKLDELGDEIGVVAWGPHGELAAGTYAGLVWIDGERFTVGDGVVGDLAWSDEGALAVATEGSEVVVIRDGRVERLVGHGAAVTQVAWAGERVVSTSEDGTMRVWGEGLSQAYTAEGAALRALDIAPNGERAAAGGDDGVVHLWPTRPARDEAEVRAELAELTTARIDDERVLATPQPR